MGCSSNPGNDLSSDPRDTWYCCLDSTGSNKHGTESNQNDTRSVEIWLICRTFCNGLQYELQRNGAVAWMLAGDDGGRMESSGASSNGASRWSSLKYRTLLSLCCLVLSLIHWVHQSYDIPRCFWLSLFFFRIIFALLIAGALSRSRRGDVLLSLRTVMFRVNCAMLF